jgi:CHAT domain-containing protein
VGLTRAFQYAGARSVVASLWKVADASTAELMRRFYGHLARGESRDVALQRAQQELIREPIQVEAGEVTISHDFSHPYHWAAFQLIGDWR